MMRSVELPCDLVGQVEAAAGLSAEGDRLEVVGVGGSGLTNEAICNDTLDALLRYDLYLYYLVKMAHPHPASMLISMTLSCSRHGRLFFFSNQVSCKFQKDKMSTFVCPKRHVEGECSGIPPFLAERLRLRGCQQPYCISDIACNNLILLESK